MNTLLPLLVKYFLSTHWKGHMLQKESIYIPILNLLYTHNMANSGMSYVPFVMFVM